MKFNYKVYHLLFFSSALILLNSCATFHQQQGSKLSETISPIDTMKSINHKFILIGDGGNANDSISEPNFKFLKQRISNSDKNTTVLFLGDNIYPKGLPDSLNPARKTAEEILNKQLDLVEDFEGKTIFLAGNHDWYSKLEGLIEQKNYVNKHLNNKKAFMPKKYESIDKIEINDDITLITIDSEWFIQDWNKYENINKESEIRNREDFFEEFKSLINKNQNKVTLVAIHHPLFSGGDHAGYFSFRKHIFPIKNIPLPVLGSVINYLRKTTGASPADTQYKLYQSLIKRLKTIAMNQNQVIFISGHDHNLQYIEQEGVKQIISGSASKIEEARAIEPISFSVGKFGYGILDVYDDKETELKFYVTENNEENLVFQRSIYKQEPYTKVFPEVLETEKTTSIYRVEKTKKSDFYKFLFGNHYRTIYGIDITAPVVNLDTIFGGLKPTISGGGNQSMSLRLEDANGKEYVMRGVKKNASQFLQTAVFKDVYVKDKLKKTYVLSFVDDFYTTSHPYVPFIMADFADAANLYHTNPKLYYIPKQNALGKYNDSYGDELYMIEERPSSSQIDAPNFGNPVDIVSTQDVLQNIEKDSKYCVDEQMYLRARVFDFLIGDWDRHADQWRWSEFREGDSVVYRPIGRDRDQAFAKIDGKLLKLIMYSPAMRHMQSFNGKFGNPRWMNKTAFPLDKVFLQSMKLEDWQKTAKEIVVSISDEVIIEAFSKMPLEVQTKETNDIQEILKERRENLVAFTEKYYHELMKYGVVAATNKDNILKIKTSKEKVVVQEVQLKKSGEQQVRTYSYDPKVTKEIWIYGLNDEDRFEVTGEKSSILIRLIGGKSHDYYDISSRNKIKIYDYKSEVSTIIPGRNTRKILRDNYDRNSYDYRNSPINTFTLLPDLNYNKDNGIMLGFNANLISQKFIYHPFSQQHNLRAKIDFATSGTIVEYLGKFKNNSRSWYFQIDGVATTSNFSQNYFGYGNETGYNRDLFKINYNRVRTAQYNFKPSYNYMGRNGGNFLVGPTFESVKIMNTNDRFIDTNLDTDHDNYKSQAFYGIQGKYEFENYNHKSNPSLGLGFLLHYAFRSNTKNFNENHSAITSKLHVLFPLTYSNIVTLETSFYGKTMIGDHYHFYQAADLGSNTFLRGYRQNRFVGRTAFAQSTNINFKISDWNDGIIPLSYGGFIGYDYGRVWQDNEKSDKWHSSYGGGLWMNVIETITLKVNVFKSSEDVMFTFGLGVGF
ncbi:metallophosphoesterase [Flavobacterium sp. I3-2]|uniref:metallophosphoesterase n=1 Tax=Flavobacterium sp. I3-2 TaxID=2748319 RepID=UPI0015AD514E|nr:metallophosphoesterase [Flavobacterium sp. I3-2]